VIYLILNLIALVLVISFVVLVGYEERRGVRFFAHAREGFDARITRLQFILTHVDLVAFAKEELRRVGSQLSHVLVVLSLRAVRAIERLLTRLIIYLRTRHPIDTPQEDETRPFLKALTDFKDRLKNTRKDNFDIE
jgi:hypothetical protein